MSWELLQADSADALPRVLPSTWTEMPGKILGVYAHVSGLRVISSVARDPAQDNRRWLHVSMSRRDRLPSYEDMRRVKDLFIGPERKAIQIFPKESEYCNRHAYCLHLWSCLDGDTLPDFRAGGEI